jgi:hypothetical protein
MSDLNTFSCTGTVSRSLAGKINQTTIFSLNSTIGNFIASAIISSNWTFGYYQNIPNFFNSYQQWTQY